MRRRSRLGIAAAAAVLALAAAVSWQASRRTRPPPGPLEAPAPVVEPSPAAAPAEPPDPRPRTLAARATFTCEGVTGEAVFVAPDRALASIPCREGQGQVHLSDGRDLLAGVLPGAPPGTSVLHLPGASATFVPPGSATGLSDGAALFVAFDGAGPETVGEATARGLLPVDGLPHLRAEEAAAPLAGPVVDAGGRLVGVVPSTPPDPLRPWLAVPIEAFASMLGRDVPAGWRTIAEQAADQDRQAQGELWNRLHRSEVLLSAIPGPDGLALVVARAARGRPPVETVRLEIVPPARDCDPAGRIVDWRTGPGAFDGVPAPPELLARLSRLAPPAGGDAVWVGRGVSRLDCDLGRVADGATLSIPGSDPLAPVPFRRSELLAAAAASAGNAGNPVAVAPPDDEQARAAAAEEEAAWEVGWRQAFQEANNRVAQAKQHRLDLQAQREEARGNFQYALEQQLEGDLEIARLEEKRAEEALSELDRRASLAAVPRAWRRAE